MMETKAVIYVILTVTVHGVVGKSLQKESTLDRRHSHQVCVENEQTPHEKRCNMYYRCVYGIKVIKECPEGKLFNTDISNCDHRYNVNCGHRESDTDEEAHNSVQYPEATSSIEEESSNRIQIPLECPEKEDPYEFPAVLPHETSYNHFYKCIDGHKYMMKCPEPLLFNPQSSNCDWPRNVIRDIRYQAKFTTPSSKETGKSEESSEENDVKR